MTGKPLSGYLNRMRRNLASLDESIENVRKAPKGEKPADKRARLKLLRDLIELPNSEKQRGDESRGSKKNESA